jgi:type IV pilus assembly protein PilC
VVIESLNVSSATIGNEKIKSDLEIVKREIEQGVSLYESFKKSKGFPVMMVEMIGVGESTGMMVVILDKVTKQIDEDVEYSLNRFLTMLEPMLIIFVGGIVMMVLLAIYLPIISIWKGLGI